MAGEIDPIGTRKDGLDAFLEEKLAEGFAIETRTDTHAIIFRRPKGLRRFTSGHEPRRFVREGDRNGRVTMGARAPRRSERRRPPRRASPPSGPRLGRVALPWR